MAGVRRRGRGRGRGVAAGVTNAVAAAVFLLGAVLLFVTAPHHGEFWWSDAPRHALNGVFVKDLIATMPAHPGAWAMQYYAQYRR
jgi:hypothetical protein